MVLCRPQLVPHVIWQTWKDTTPSGRRFEGMDSMVQVLHAVSPQRIAAVLLAHSAACVCSKVVLVVTGVVFIRLSRQGSSSVAGLTIAGCVCSLTRSTGSLPTCLSLCRRPARRPYLLGFRSR
jgi:hypothetical protein